MKLRREYTDEELEGLLAEARYYLGRTLYLGELDYDRAVSELQAAVRHDPSNAAALYHLGQAVRAQVDRNILQRAEDALRQYLLLGAPLGYEDEVREFLGSRKKPEIAR